jgi:hypothetical protein
MTLLDSELVEALACLPEDARKIVLDRLARSRTSSRLDHRDRLIREFAEKFYGHLDRPPRAARIAHDLVREGSVRSPAPVNSRREAVRAILDANGGKPIGKKQLWNILVGVRTPRKLSNLPAERALFSSSDSEL